MLDINKVPEELRQHLVDAYVDGMSGVLEYVSPQPGSYESLLEYERSEYLARIEMVLKALAKFYSNDSAALLRFIQNRGQDEHK